MESRIFKRKWLAASDARAYAEGEGFRVDPKNKDYANKQRMKIILRCKDTTWFYWQHLVEEPPRKKKVVKNAKESSSLVG